jgi:hypothetical protein
MLRKMIKMRSLIASVALLVVAIGEASSQTAGKREPETPAEMTEAIAHAIDMKMPKMPSVPLALESATSHDNFVELHYRANEVRLFPHNDSEREERRLRFAYRFCFDSRISPLKKHGVVIHQVLTAPDNSAPFEFIIDEPTCAALAAEIKTRAAGMKRPESLDEPKDIPAIPIPPRQAEHE